MGMEAIPRAPLTGREVAKFGVAVGFLGIFYDAAIAHGMFWENDPYWSYWITKTFLITSVFSLVTAFFGIGLAQGAIGTLVHTAILEVYYQWLSPIGLPREAQWLDFDHLWITGSRACPPTTASSSRGTRRRCGSGGAAQT